MLQICLSRISISTSKTWILQETTDILMSLSKSSKKKI